MIFNIKNMIITQCTYKIYSYKQEVETLINGGTELTKIMKNIHELYKSDPTVLNENDLAPIYEEMADHKDSCLFKSDIGAILKYITKDIKHFTVFVLIFTEIVRNNRSSTLTNITWNSLAYKFNYIDGMKRIRPFRNQLKKREDILYNLGIFFTVFDSLLGDENINQAIRILSDVKSFDASNGDVVRDKFLDLYKLDKQTYKKYIDKIDIDKFCQLEELIIKIYKSLYSIRNTFSSAHKQENSNENYRSQAPDNVNIFGKLYSDLHRVVAHYLLLCNDKHSHSSTYYAPEVIGNCEIYHNVTTIAITATFQYVTMSCFKMVQSEIVELENILKNIKKHINHQIDISGNDKNRLKLKIKHAFANHNSINKCYEKINKSIKSYKAQYDNSDALVTSTEEIRPSEAIKQSFNYKTVTGLGAVGGSVVLASLKLANKKQMSQQRNHNNDHAAPVEEHSVDSPNTNSDASSDAGALSEEDLPSNPSEPVISDSSSNS